MNEPKSFVITLAGSADIIVPVSDTVYTDSFKFGDVDTFAVSYITSCTGFPDIRIQMEQSMVPPVTENVADANFTVPNTMADIEVSLTSKDIHHAALTPVCISYVRFKITEQTGIIADTTVNMWLNLQKKFAM